MHPKYLHQPVTEWAELPTLSEEVGELLDEKADLYNSPEFIPPDPVSIPHAFSRKEDREIAGLLTATIAWGRRDLVLRSGWNLMQRMDNSPYEFVSTASETELCQLDGFVHRTFNAADLRLFLRALRRLYAEEGGIEGAFAGGVRPEDQDVRGGLIRFRERFFLRLNAPQRSGKHVSDITSGSAAKRLNMFLRWMVRHDSRGVDLGLWSGIRMDQLIIPLDVHTGRVARALGLLERSYSDWRAALMLNEQLRRLSPTDPVRYDYALFGMGVYEGYGKSL